MTKIPASVFIITLNEAQNIGRALQSVADFDQIVVVDSGSSDATLEIARGFTSDIFTQTWLGYSRQKALALSKCSHDWCLNIDADEVASPELIQEIRQTIADNNCDALSIPIDDIFLGRVNHPWIRRNAKPRFFRKNAGEYGDAVVHEGFKVSGKLARAQGAIRHYGERSIAIKVEKNNHYSSLRAEERHRKGKRFNLLKLLVAFPFAFFRSYILRRALLNGLPGFIGSVVNGFYAFLKEAKLYEVSRSDKDSN